MTNESFATEQAFPLLIRRSLCSRHLLPQEKAEKGEHPKSDALPKMHLAVCRQAITFLVMSRQVGVMNSLCECYEFGVAKRDDMIALLTSNEA